MEAYPTLFNRHKNFGAFAATLTTAIFAISTLTYRAVSSNGPKSQMLWQGQVNSMDVPPQPKLAYNGPVYSGSGAWMWHGKTIKPSAHPRLQHAMKRKGVRGHGDAQHAHSEHSLSVKAAAQTPVQHKKLESSVPTWLAKHAPGLARDIKTAKQLYSKGQNSLSAISEGFGKAFDIHDDMAQMKKPVKVLTHV
ncbi:hypothetical protein GUITHDRAFT_152692 [Guillardia theta CCMP2712]|uniref:Uncharacterized protein n=2 Tax=Guillardia theta TaxID=55529 RepID=L1J9Y5_GUITC|nr:hypothetical protein GUITHDRAFT_152692 [Guillardia theta CCMP2712]EKX45348.1 hypothetical protein GUITHDRAFT_152692 [Guillardia theta CCMP2712]|eukprot:XP_005832328.1 hypothetical protein GUITHDRAFT_152692 [Guillardia theta CCMP2712]